MYEIHDEQTRRTLSTGHPTVQEATDRLEELLTEVRQQVEATGDSAQGMVLEWEIREEATGRGVAWHYGAPVPLAGHE